MLNLNELSSVEIIGDVLRVERADGVSIEFRQADQGPWTTAMVDFGHGRVESAEFLTGWLLENVTRIKCTQLKNLYRLTYADYSGEIIAAWLCYVCVWEM